MRQKQIAARRARNRELARLDAANRCPMCKRVVVDGDGPTYRWLLPDRRFCSLDCLADFEALQDRTMGSGR